MAETIFCLDIHEDKIAAVSVDNSSGVSIVKGYGSQTLGEAPFPETLEQIKEQCGFTEGQCRITFGAELFSYRNLSLPFTDKNKIGQILPLELEDLSPIKIDSLAIDFLISKTKPNGVDILAAMIDKAVLSDCLSSLNQSGIDPETIGISGVDEALIVTGGENADFALIDIDATWATIIIVVGGNIALIRSIATPPELYAEDAEIRSRDFAVNIRQTLLVSGAFDINSKHNKVYISGVVAPYEGLAKILSTTLEGTPVKVFQQSGQPLIKIDSETASPYLPEQMDRALSVALRGSGKYYGFNFRKGAFKKRKTVAEYRSWAFRFAVPAAVLFLISFIYWGYSYSKLRSLQDDLNAQITQVFKETLPEVTRIVNPVQQLAVVNKEILNTYKPGGLSGAELTTVELLAELSTRIPPNYAVKVVRLVADMDVIRLKAVTGDFNTVDNVQKELEKSPYFKEVSISSANQSPKGDEVSFELKIQRTL
jgi:type II secretory pathway component PulL